MPIRPETDALIDYLNELASLDPVFVGRLISARVACNDAILHHPTVQASQAKELRGSTHAHVDGMPDDQGVAGFLGVLNGFCGTFDDGPKKGWGAITAIVEDDGSVSSFRRTDNSTGVS